MKFYQLVASGTMVAFSGKHQIYSKKIYGSVPSDAQVEEFVELCQATDAQGCFVLNADMKVSARELELVE